MQTFPFERPMYRHTLPDGISKPPTVDVKSFPSIYSIFIVVSLSSVLWWMIWRIGLTVFGVRSGSL